MAKKETDTATETPKDLEPEGSGWGRVNPEDGERTYAYMQPGFIFRGLLLGRFRRNDKPDAYYYQIRLTLATPAKTREGEIVEAQPGTVLTIDERAALTSLQEVAEKDSHYEVWIHLIEKVAIGGGNTFWKMDVQSRKA